MRSVKLLLLNSIFIAITLLEVIATASTNIDMLTIDYIISGLIILGMIINIIGLAINLFYGQAYKEYLITKRNR
jgi:hypothetical protein